MKLLVVCLLILADACIVLPFSAAAQQVSIDTSVFQVEFPEEKYLFYLTGYERVLDELNLTADQQRTMTKVRGKIDLKHGQHQTRIRELKGNLEKQVVEDLQKRFMSEISDELTQAKKIISVEQSTRLRQIAFQYFFVIKNRTNQDVNVRRLLLDKTVAEGLQIDAMQRDMIVHAYETLEAGLSEIDPGDADQHRQLLAGAHKSFLEILNEEQGRVVNNVVGSPAQALHYPSNN